MSGLGVYLGCLFGAEPEGAFAELRWRLPGGRMGRKFEACGSRDRLTRLIEARGGTTDLYIGVAPRSRQAGTRSAVERVHVLWADCDEPEAMAALESFVPAPSMVIGSGRGRHAYWSLWPPVDPDEAERANRRIAQALGSDMRATDAARILRPPGTFNFKTGEPVPVVVESINVEIFTAEDVAGRLPDPPARAGSRTNAPTRPLRAVPDRLADICPPEYVEALTGLVPDREGKVSCPFHEDRTPSFHAYPDADRGWFCFSCERGGRVYDLAAHLAGYRLPLRGAEFIAVRNVLLDHLLSEAA